MVVSHHYDDTKRHLALRAYLLTLGMVLIYHVNIVYTSPTNVFVKYQQYNQAISSTSCLERKK